MKDLTAGEKTNVFAVYTSWSGFKGIRCPCQSAKTSVLTRQLWIYLIHRCRMTRGRYLYILGPKINNWTLSTTSFWHNNLSSFWHTAFIYFIHRCRTVRGRYLCILGVQRSWSKTEFSSDTITRVTFQIQPSYLWPLWKRRGILLCTCRSVGLYVGMSVSLNLVQLITQERFAQEASNLIGR